MRALIATLIALMLFTTTPVVAGAFEDGLAAYRAGDYQKAFRLWKPVAEQGHYGAQYNIGLMYAAGDGVPQNDAKAVHWFTKAAKQGFAKAQLSLGLMYTKGEGVPKNYVRGYAWLSISAAQGYERGELNKEITALRLTPAQIAEGQKLSGELWEKYVVPIQTD